MAGPLPRRVYLRRRAVVATLAVLLLAFVAALAVDRTDHDATEDTAVEGDGSAEPADGGDDVSDSADLRSDSDTDTPKPAEPGAEPEAPETTWRSTGEFRVATGESEVAGSGPTRTYTVEVEEGAGVEADVFAAKVDEILADPRGWTASEGISLQRVAGADRADFAVRLAAPDTVDVLCAPLETEGEVSCAQNGLAVINTMRWHRGAEPSGLDLADYRRYLISHEVGHLLGHGHVECPEPGAPAPVMMQQTLDIGDCAPNPWPDPEAADPGEAAGG